MWATLLTQVENSAQALDLLYDILAWGRYNTSSSCLFHVTLLTDAIEIMYLQNNQVVLTELLVYLTSLLKHLHYHGYDSRPSLNLILKLLYVIDDSRMSYQNLVVHLLVDNIHSIAPIYLADFLRILKVSKMRI